MSDEIHVPPEWKRVDVSALTGTIMVIGASDTGKSTFARYLFRRLAEHYPRIGFLDCDVGQSSLGLPTTLTLLLTTSTTGDKPPRNERLAYFVGAVSPRGHILPAVIGAYKLQRRAQQWASARWWWILPGWWARRRAVGRSNNGKSSFWSRPRCSLSPAESSWSTSSGPGVVIPACA